ncbi:hypothetical protein B566_EDAN016978 [Ephemera danica]|nr:hypothetical protein B566_EDAN016978 [Ephemera danica]
MSGPTKGPQPADKLFQCSFCPRSYSWKQTLVRHMADAHTSLSTQPVSCSICGQVYKNKSSRSVPPLPSLIAAPYAIPRTKKVYKCPQCANSYEWKCNLRKHERLKHGRIPGTFVCDNCGLQFCLKKELVEHKPNCTNFLKRIR